MIPFSNTFPDVRCAALQVWLSVVDYIWRASIHRSFSVGLFGEEGIVSTRSPMGCFRVLMPLARSRKESRLTSSGLVVLVTDTTTLPSEMIPIAISTTLITVCPPTNSTPLPMVAFMVLYEVLSRGCHLLRSGSSRSVFIPIDDTLGSSKQAILRPLRASTSLPSSAANVTP